MKLTTTAFQEGEVIPDKHTCHGENIAPDLHLSDVPEKTAVFALIMDDPDAPNGTFDHWIVWNIPGNLRQFTKESKLETFGNGLNSYGELGYKGPCPPPGGPHHYHFKLYALDKALQLPNRSRKSDLENAMKGHVLAKTELVGTFQHKPKK